MSGRNPHEAVRNFIEPLQKALSCITPAVLSISRGGYEPRAEPHGLILNQNRPVPLEMTECGVARITLVVAMEYSVVEADGERGPWKVTTRQYNFELERGGERLFAFPLAPAATS